MSTVERVNFEPFSDILQTQRRDFPLADSALADPLNALALVDGEWMVINDSYQIVRAADVTGANGLAATQTGFVLFAERGRYDVRAMAETKMPIVQMGDYEADTRIFDAALAAGTSAAAIISAGQPLRVATLTIGSRKYVGLAGHSGAGGAPIVGRVTRLPASNGGKLRFMKASAI
jgi:hypothetical protein